MVEWWVPVITAIVAAIGGYLVREFDKRRERETEAHCRKEERYVNFINCLRGFTVSSPDTNLVKKFLDELNLAWLYCPDDVIKKANGFIYSVSTERSLDKNPPSDQEKAEAWGQMLLAIRKDLLSRQLIKKTTLKASDFKLYKTN